MTIGCTSHGVHKKLAMSCMCGHVRIVQSIVNLHCCWCVFLIAILIFLVIFSACHFSSVTMTSSFTPLLRSVCFSVARLLTLYITVHILFLFPISYPVWPLPIGPSPPSNSKMVPKSCCCNRHVVLNLSLDWTELSNSYSAKSNLSGHLISGNN